MRLDKPLLGVLAGVLPFLAFWTTLSTGRVVDLDLWHQLALIREAVRTGSLPMTDVFAYTPTLPLSVNHEWGAGALAYGVLSVAGGPGIMLLNIALALAAAGTAAAVAWRRGAAAATLAMASCMGVPILAAAFIPLRAQAYSFVLFAVLLYAIERDSAGDKRALFAWLPFWLVWVNFHGSIAVAFAALGLYWLERVLTRQPSRRAAVVLAFMAGLTLANPYGTELLLHLWRSMRMQRPLIVEWSPIWIGPYVAMLRPLSFLIAIGLYAAAKRCLHVHAIALLILTGAAGILHLKLLPYFVLAWIAYVPAGLRNTPLARAVESIVAENRVAARATWVLLICACVVGLGASRFWEPRVPGRAQQQSYPVGAVRYLADQRFSGCLLTNFNQGAYVSWKLHPRVRVSLDSRYDVAYPEWLVYSIQRVYLGQWRPFMKRYPADAVLIPRGAPLESAIAPHWTRVYRDGEFSIFAAPGSPLRAQDFGDRVFDGSLP